MRRGDHSLDSARGYARRALPLSGIVEVRPLLRGVYSCSMSPTPVMLVTILPYRSGSSHCCISRNIGRRRIRSKRVSQSGLLAEVSEAKVAFSTGALSVFKHLKRYTADDPLRTEVKITRLSAVGRILRGRLRRTEKRHALVTCSQLTPAHARG